MSRMYNLEHAINECIVEKNKSKSAKDSYFRDHDFYQGCWDALNKWIESRLRKNKGANAAPFASFNWEFRNDGGGVRRCRPIFILGDGFVKDHNVLQQVTASVLNLAEAEEINYSKLAIKFSTSLTKDMIFTGLRDIFVKIGEFLDRSYEFEIQFSVGFMYAKERRVKFEFDVHRLEQILPESMTSEGVAERMGLAFKKQGHGSKKQLKPIDSMQLAQRPGTGSSVGSRASSARPRTASAALMARNKAPKLNLSLQLPPVMETDSERAESRGNAYEMDTSAMMPTAPRFEAPAGGAAGEGSAVRDRGGFQSAPAGSTVPFVTSNSNNGDDSDDEYVPKVRPLSPELQRVIASMNPPSPILDRKERRVLRCQSVSDQAFQRCIEDVERDALLEARERERKANEEMDRLMLETTKKQQEQKDRHKLKEVLDAQLVEIHKQRKVKTPFSETSLPMRPVDDDMKAENKKALCASLKNQMQENSERSKADREKRLLEEARFLDYTAMELDLQTATERASHLETQRALLEDWERAAHIKTLKKLKNNSVVRTYVNKNLQLPGAERYSVQTPQSSFLNSARATSAGIGFDARK